MSIKNIKNEIKLNFGLNLHSAKKLHNTLGINFRISPTSISSSKTEKLNSIFNKMIINKTLSEVMEKCLSFKKKINIHKNTRKKIKGDKKKINPSKKKE